MAADARRRALARPREVWPISRSRRHRAGAREYEPDIVEDACAFAWMQLVHHHPDPQRSRRAWLVTVAEREAWLLHGAQCLASAGQGHLIREATESLREIQAEKAEPQPVNERAARLNELEESPPSWLKKVIGTPGSPDKATRRLAWRRAALAIDDYRSRYGASLGDELFDQRRGTIR